MNHKQLKIEHRTKDIKMVILTDEDEKRLLTLPLPTRDLTVSDILEAGNIAFSSSDYMHCEDCHLEEDFNFIVVMLPEGCDRAYAEYKIEKFKKNHKKVGDTNCKYCFLLKNEGVKCGNCTIKTNDPCASNERLMILSEIVNKFSVKSEKKVSIKYDTCTVKPPTRLHFHKVTFVCIYDRIPIRLQFKFFSIQLVSMILAIKMSDLN